MLVQTIVHIVNVELNQNIAQYTGITTLDNFADRTLPAFAKYRPH